MPNTKFKPVLLISILFFLLVILSAFDHPPAVTTTPNLTPTPTSIYAIPRLQLTEVDPLPITTPDAPTDQYTLADWNADIALHTLGIFRPGESLPNGQPNIYLTLLEESYLRFPELAQDESFLRELAIIRDSTNMPLQQPILSDTLSSLPIYTQILEDSLNHGKLQPENVEEWIYKNMVALNVDTIQTTNLFGEGKTVWAYNILKFDGYWQAILFVTQNEDETYTVSTFSNGEWEYLQRWNYDLYIQDLNGNGIPEIIKDKLVWWHGAENAYSELYIYEWDGKHFVDRLFNSPSIQIFFTDSGEEPDRWIYEDQSDGTFLIIGKQNTFTTINCPYYIENYYYLWTGYSFELDHIEVEPLPDNTSEKCTVIWTLAAGQQNPKTIPVLSTALSDWPKELDNEFGPAARDYLTLWMAQAAALQGDDELALNTLNTLIQNPNNPEYSAVSKIAQVYKNTYINYGPYQACLSVDHWKSNDRLRLNDYKTSFSEEFLQTLVNHWGFSDKYYASAYPCDPQTTFEVWMQNQTFSTKAQLTRWLYDNEVQWNGLRQMDINNDGKMDWLFITNFQNQYNSQLWAILQLENGILPFELYNAYQKIETLNISVNQYFPSDNGIPVQIYRMGNQVVVFKIVGHDEQYYPFIQFTAGDNENPARGVEIKDDILTIYFKRGMSQYKWQDQHQRFELLQSTVEALISPSPEEMLFEDQNPQTVINELETWFATINPNTNDSWESYYVESTLPYRTYLLGLAHELNGDEQNAIQTYYDLWQTYPESPFTIIARYKLEKME